MNIKKYLAIFSLIFAAGFSAEAQLIDKPAAAVNMVKPGIISVKQLEAQVNELIKLQQMSGKTVTSMTRAEKLEVLDLMISNELIMQGAEEKGIKAEESEIQSAIASQKAQLEQQYRRSITDQQYRTAVERQGTTWNEYRDQIGRQIIQQKYLASEKQQELQNYITMPGYDEIETFYRQNRTQFSNPDMVRYSQIFISTLNKSSSEVSEAERKANEASRKYTNGSESFEKLVSDYTEDQAGKYRNGDSGYIAYNDPAANAYLGQNFMNQVFKLKLNEVSRVIKSNIGYHIVKVTDIREAKLLSLDDQILPTTQQTVREYIAQQLIAKSQNEALSRALNELVADLKEKADIRIFEENID